MNKVYCSNCGNAFKDDDIRCPECSAVRPNYGTASNASSTTSVLRTSASPFQSVKFGFLMCWRRPKLLVLPVLMAILSVTLSHFAYLGLINQQQLTAQPLMRGQMFGSPGVGSKLSTIALQSIQMIVSSPGNVFSGSLKGFETMLRPIGDFSSITLLMYAYNLMTTSNSTLIGFFVTMIPNTLLVVVFWRTVFRTVKNQPNFAQNNHPLFSWLVWVYVAWIVVLVVPNLLFLTNPTRAVNGSIISFFRL